MQSHNLLNSVQIIFFPDKINIMQYFYLLNVRKTYIRKHRKCCIEKRLPAAPGTSHACASRGNYENNSRNDLIVGL